MQNINAPLYSQSIFEHFDSPHKIELDIVERPSFALEEGDTCLCDGANNGERRDEDKARRRTHPHLCTLDLPLISVAFVSPPFGLKKVEDTREGKVLSALRWEGDLRLLWTLLLLGALLLVLLKFLLHLQIGAEHWNLDGVVLRRREEVGRASLWVQSRGLPRVDLHNSPRLRRPKQSTLVMDTTLRLCRRRYWRARRANNVRQRAAAYSRHTACRANAEQNDTSTISQPNLDEALTFLF